MEMDKEKFMEKLKGLQELAKKKKNVLENREVKDYFHDTPLNDQQMEKVYQYLEAHGIDVLRISENDADVDSLLLLSDDDINLDDEEEVDMENLDLSVPEGSASRIRSACISRRSEKCRFCPRRKRSTWPSGWNRETRAQKNVWLRQICVWWSPLPSAM